MNPDTEREVINTLIQEQAAIEQKVALMKAMGGVELGHHDEPEEPRTMADVGIHNRQAARRAGFRNPKKQRRMATKL